MKGKEKKKNTLDDQHESFDLRAFCDTVIKEIFLAELNENPQLIHICHFQSISGAVPHKERERERERL